MRDIVIDFETYWSDTYSLLSMTTREYIMSDHFGTTLLSVVDGNESFVLEPMHINKWVTSVDWSNVRLISHNIAFDGAILAWRFGCIPKAYFCTAQGSRTLWSHLIGSASLARVAEQYGMKKDTEALFSTKGKRFWDIQKDPAFERFKEYCLNDSIQCSVIAHDLLNRLPEEMVEIIDIVSRMYILGRLELHQNTLCENLEQAQRTREALLQKCGVESVDVIRSRETFARLLTSHGVNPPTKISPRTGKETYAFSRQDPEFVDLLNHDNENVRALVEMRLNAASTIEETRTKTLLNIRQYAGRVLHTPLLVSGAHTHRFSGTGNLNLQNIPRKSLIKKAIRAPDGYSIVAVDASQIEARLLAWTAGCTGLVSAFANKEDVYSTFASDVFNREINKTDNPNERFIGKLGVLSLGYGTGASKMYHTLTMQGAEPTEEFAKHLVTTYREKYPEIPRFWRACQDTLPLMIEGAGGQIGPMKIGRQKLISPFGIDMHYPSLRVRTDESGRMDGYEFYRHKYKQYTKIYGAALTENIIQHLAWTIIAYTMIKIRRRYPDWFCALQVHDELVYVVPEHEAELACRVIEETMCEQPPWATFRDYPIPLAAEGGYGRTYADAK